MTIGLVGLILLCLCNIVAWCFFAKKIVDAKKQLHDEFSSLRKEVRILTSGMTGVGRHLVEVEKQFEDMVDKQGELAEYAQAEATDPAYEQAARLIAMGASIDDVMSSCALPRAEVELLIQVHNKQGLMKEYDDLEVVESPKLPKTE